jgi:hypothetical protein
MPRRISPWRSLLLATVVLLMAAAPTLAASPSPTAVPTLSPAFVGVPDAPTVAAAFAQGSDTFEGSARQSAALSLVEGIAMDIESLLPAMLNPVETRFIGDFGAAEGAIVTRIKATLPADQQAYETGTRFAAWRALIDTDRADPALQNSVLGLFSPAFRAAQPSLPALLKQNSAKPVLPPPPAPQPPGFWSVAGLTAVISDFWSSHVLPSLPILVGMLLLVAVIGWANRGDSAAEIEKKHRLRLDPKDPFLLLVGKRQFQLVHSTGRVIGVTKTPITNVYGGTTSGYTNFRGDLVITSSPVTSRTTIRDQFFIKKPDGHQRPVQLTGWDLALADDHLVSMVWFNDTPVMALNHTTEMGAVDWACLKPYLTVDTGNAMAAGCMVGLILAVASALLLHVHPLAGLIAVTVGAAAGAATSPSPEEVSDPLPAFKRGGVAALRQALVDEAAPLS